MRPLTLLAIDEPAGGLRVLLVEDSAPMRERWIDLLLDHPAVGELTVANNLHEAQDCIHDDDFDAVVLDVALPDGSGIELLRQLRREGRPTVVIVVTSDVTPELREIAALLRADYVFDKVTEDRRILDALCLAAARLSLPAGRSPERLSA